MKQTFTISIFTDNSEKIILLKEHDRDTAHSKYNAINKALRFTKWYVELAVT